MKLSEILSKMHQDEFWVLYSDVEESIWANEDYPTLFPSKEIAQETIDLFGKGYEDYKPCKVLQLEIDK